MQLQHQMGFPGSSVPVNSVTLYAIEGAQMELLKLEDECKERRHRLELNLKELRKICLELGEDEGEHAAAVHASLGDARSTAFFSALVHCPMDALSACKLAA